MQRTIIVLLGLLIFAIGQTAFDPNSLRAQISGGSVTYDSGTISATATPTNYSHANGTSVGGLIPVALVRVAGGSGIVTNFGFKSAGASTGNYVVRIWQKNPTATTCTDNTPFASNATDDLNLITLAPLSITPLAPASTTGDSATYAWLPSLTLDYRNRDQTQNLYVCIVTVLTDTADAGNLVTVSMSGPQN